MKKISYLINNKSSAPVTINGRFPIRIEGHCSNMQVSLPDTESMRNTTRLSDLKTA